MEDCAVASSDDIKCLDDHAINTISNTNNHMIIPNIKSTELSKNTSCEETKESNDELESETAQTDDSEYFVDKKANLNKFGASRANIFDGMSTISNASHHMGLRENHSTSKVPKKKTAPRKTVEESSRIMMGTSRANILDSESVLSSAHDMMNGHLIHGGIKEDGVADNQENDQDDESSDDEVFVTQMDVKDDNAEAIFAVAQDETAADNLTAQLMNAGIDDFGFGAPVQTSSVFSEDTSIDEESCEEKHNSEIDTKTPAIVVPTSVANITDTTAATSSPRHSGRITTIPIDTTSPKQNGRGRVSNSRRGSIKLPSIN